MFAIAAAFIAGAALILALAVRPNAERPRALRTGMPVPERVLTFEGPTPVPTATAAAPIEEGAPAGSGSAHDVASCRHVARAFLAGYLLYAYGRYGHIAHASSALRHQLRSDRPRVPAAERRLRARVVLLQTDGVSDQRADLH